MRVRHVLLNFARPLFFIRTRGLKFKPLFASFREQFL
jgi:hypothetical protein